MREGRRQGGHYCVTHSTEHHEAGPARFGFIVSRRVGGAVVRNRVRRRLAAIAERWIRDGFSGADVVFRVLPAAAAATFTELQREADRALDRIEHRVRAAGGSRESA